MFIFKLKLVVVVCFSFTLLGCGSKGVDFATKAQTLGECTLSGKTDCNKKLSDNSEMTVVQASLLSAMDSVRVSTTLTEKADCVAVGNTAGKSVNSKLVINDAIIMQYGQPGPSFSYLDQVCTDSNSFVVSLTVAKSL